MSLRLPWVYITAAIFAMLSFNERIFCTCTSWQTISECTVTTSNNHSRATTILNCGFDKVLIGWSHYGVHTSETENFERCQPKLTDCVMDYTDKIAELCDGMSTCQISLISQFVHKCSRQASYLFVTFQCVSVSANQEICQTSNMVGSNIFLSSPNFPNEYGSNLNCSCKLSASSDATISVETLFFLLQDNDYLHVSPMSENLSGHLPMYTSLNSEDTTRDITVSFTTDHSLSFSGFWLNLKGFAHCPYGWHGLDKNCFMIIPGGYTWQDALKKCEEKGGHLPILENVWENRQFRAWLKSKEQESVWLGFSSPTEISESRTWIWSSDLSWWPWSDEKASSGSCVVSQESGWKIVPCEERHSVVCQLRSGRSTAPLTLTCEQKASDAHELFNDKNDERYDDNSNPISKITSHFKSRGIFRDQGVLTLMLSVFSAVLIVVNIGVCLLCYRRLFEKNRTLTTSWNYNKTHLDSDTLKCMYPNQAQKVFCNDLCSNVANYHVYETIVGIPNDPNNPTFSLPVMDNGPLFCSCCRKQAFAKKSLSRRSPESGYSSTNRQECCYHENSRIALDEPFLCCLHDECSCSLYVHPNPSCN